ncbi:MAG: hypothetical protein P1U34_01865 [Coxiellaceae bacterium]|nr:hypothetical protein [Coxiellaceae bacterium]
MRLNPRAGLAVGLLALAQQAQSEIVVDFTEGGSACPRFTFFCKDFMYRVWDLADDGTRTLLNEGAGAVDANTLSSGDSCLDLVGARAIVNCIRDDMPGALKNAFEQAGEGALAVCRDNIPRTNYKCTDFSSFFSQSGPMTADACSALSNSIRNSQTNCASFLTTAKAWAVIIGCGVAGAAVLAGVCYIGYKCNEKRNASNRQASGRMGASLPARHGMGMPSV